MGEKTNAPHHMSDNHKPKLSAKKAGIALALVIALGLSSCDKQGGSFQETIKKIPTPSQLKGRKVNDLYSYYLGYGGGRAQIGDTIVFEPNKVIEELYEKKFKSIPDGFEVAKNYYENVVSKIDFSQSQPSNIQKYTTTIQTSIDEINSNFDWRGFTKKKLGGNEAAGDVFQKICKKIDANSLLAYSMTELFPSIDTMNKEIMDFLLRHGGEELVYHLPAVNDDYASFGPYQFTSFAVYNAEGQKKGASILNDFLPSGTRIPGSVTKLEKEDHHKAAYLFAMCNIYVLLKDKANLPALKLLSQKNPNNIVQLVAIMHNKPVQGEVFLQERYRLNSNPKYLHKQTHDKKGKLSYKYDTNKNGSIDIYESRLQPSPSHGYGKKTYYNRKNINNIKM